jgi:hypothetical protein
VRWRGGHSSVETFTTAMASAFLAVDCASTPHLQFVCQHLATEKLRELVFHAEDNDGSCAANAKDAHANEVDYFRPGCGD